MCHLCETLKVIERIERQIKNIEAGGSISPGAVVDVLRASRAELARFHSATVAFDQIVSGLAVAQVVAIDVSDLSGGGQGGLH